MAEKWHSKYGVGVNNVGSYQAAGQPFLTGSDLDPGHEHLIEFPYVTRSITVMNTGSNGTVRIHFAPSGSTKFNGTFRVLGGNHFWPLDSKEDSMTMNVKCDRIFLSNPETTPGGYKLFAELTGIDSERMYLLTGSGIND